MKYAFASITKSCDNFGNFLIEENVKSILKHKEFGEANYEFDSFVCQDDKTIAAINQNDCLIVPGCTTIALKDYQGLDSVIDKISVPIFNIGASLPTGRDFGDIEKVKKFFQPVATRDPWTQDFLTKSDINAIFTGCPTLFTGNARSYRIQDGNIIFIFALGKKDEQIAILESLVEKYGEKVRVFLQNEKQREYIEKLNIDYIEYNTSKLKDELSKARIVITGRLHGTLPAIAMGVPSFFLQTLDDNRFTLLDYLGVKRYPIEDSLITQKILSAIDDPNLFVNSASLEKADELRQKILAYLDLVKSSM